MAFQGKGIFDGFSGKVGNLVGYKRGGKSIIQKKGNQRGLTGNFYWEYQQVRFNKIGIATIGDYYIQGGINLNNYENGGICPFGLASKEGGFYGKMQPLSNYVIFGFGKSSSLIHPNTYAFGVYVTKTYFRTIINGLFGAFQFHNLENRYVKIEMINGNYVVSKSTNGTNWVEMYNMSIAYTSTVYFVSSVTFSGTTFTDIHVGGLKRIEI